MMSPMRTKAEDTMDEYTHKGWMLFCPVKLGHIDDSEKFIVAPRWVIFAPVYWASIKVQQIVIGLCSIFFEDYDPQWYFTRVKRLGHSATLPQENKSGM